MLLPSSWTASSVAQLGLACASGEVRQSRERVYESAPSTWPTRPIVCPVRGSEQGLDERRPKAIVLVGKVAVRRLLPAPASVERKPIVLGPMRWVDVVRRALRRTWTAHWRRHYVEVLELAHIPKSISPPPRPPRAIRSRHRWSWRDRLARNTRFGPSQLRVTVAGVPTFLASN
jgi:hypothetical protein